VVAIAASTGGPSALVELFAKLPSQSTGAIVVAQHMPERFTRSFADRLDKAGGFRVQEADHLHAIVAGTAFVCPGGRCLEVHRRDGVLTTRVVFPSTQDRHAPSADRLFSSVAESAGERAVVVVMTGMGDDAARGVVEIRRAGGLVLAESEESAVVYGMPKAALDTGCVDEQLALPALIQRICDLLA
jgi:two-component system chemotaxis response regulator CheB